MKNLFLISTFFIFSIHTISRANPSQDASNWSKLDIVTMYQCHMAEDSTAVFNGYPVFSVLDHSAKQGWYIPRLLTIKAERSTVQKLYNQCQVALSQARVSGKPVYVNFVTGEILLESSFNNR